MTLETWEQVCRDVFGEEFTHVRLSNAVHQTNIEYGGYDIDGSNTAFVHGSLDPWQPLGLQKSLSEDAPLILINGSNHCSDIKEYEKPEKDEKLVAKSQEKIGELIGHWLKSSTEK